MDVHHYVGPRLAPGAPPPALSWALLAPTLRRPRDSWWAYLWFGDGAWVPLEPVRSLCHAQALKESMNRRTPQPVGMLPRDQLMAIFSAVKRATKGLQKEEVAMKVAKHVHAWVNSMTPGHEQDHLAKLLRHVSTRGCDVKIWLDPPAPYPAFVWLWRTLVAYRWGQPQHINLLEVSAFLVEIRRRARNSTALRGRFVNITDSQVAFHCLTKGRSSSSRLNRLIRRVAAVSFAADLTPFHIWTISKWNFADHGSRKFETWLGLRGIWSILGWESGRLIFTNGKFHSFLTISPFTTSRFQPAWKRWILKLESILTTSTKRGWSCQPGWVVAEWVSPPLSQNSARALLGTAMVHKLDQRTCPAARGADALEGLAISGRALLPWRLAALGNLPFDWFHFLFADSRGPVFACRRYRSEPSGPIGGNSLTPNQNFQATPAGSDHLRSHSSKASYPSSSSPFFFPAVAVVHDVFSSVFHLSLHLFSPRINWLRALLAAPRGSNSLLCCPPSPWLCDGARPLERSAHLSTVCRWCQGYVG